MATFQPEITTFYSIDNDIREIRYGLERFHHVILIGPAGIGKTSLQEAYLKKYGKDYYKVAVISGFEFENRKDIDVTLKEIRNYKYSLLVIDGYDQIRNSNTKEKLLRIFKEGRKYGTHVLMSTRDEIKLSSFEKNAFVHRMQRLTEKSAERLFSKLLMQENLPLESVKIFKKTLRDFNYNPSVIYQIITLLKAKTTPDNIIEGISSSIDYRNELIDYYNNSKKIIAPDQKKLITDVRVINKALFDLIKKKPSDIYNLSPRQFEIFVAELFEREGYQVELTPETRDGGKDIIVAQNNITGNLLFYVECKRFSIGRPVSINVIQRLHGAVVADKATAGIVVTSSYFSKPAINHTERIRNQMSLIDYVELNNRIKRLNE